MDDLEAIETLIESLESGAAFARSREAKIMDLSDRLQMANEIIRIKSEELEESNNLRRSMARVIADYQIDANRNLPRGDGFPR